MIKFFKDASWDEHLRLEKELAVKSRFSDLGSCRDCLARLWGFHAAAEDLTAANGASRLARRGSRIEPMRRRFGAAVDAQCARPEAQAKASAAARATFLALEEWLCGART